MIELRNRHRGDYEEVATTDDYDVIPRPRILALQQQKVVSPPMGAKKSSGAVCCFFFSLSGVVFLTTLSLYVGNNSPFLKIPDETGSTRKYLQGITGALALYVVCMFASGYYWHRSRTHRYTRSFD